MASSVNEKLCIKLPATFPYQQHRAAAVFGLWSVRGSQSFSKCCWISTKHLHRPWETVITWTYMAHQSVVFETFHVGPQWWPEWSMSMVWKSLFAYSFLRSNFFQNLVDCLWVQVGSTLFVFEISFVQVRFGFSCSLGFSGPFEDLPPTLYLY